jgi:hypothetical protein
MDISNYRRFELVDGEMKFAGYDDRMLEDLVREIVELRGEVESLRQQLEQKNNGHEPSVKKGIIRLT